jgi:hypothetical protein
MKESTSKFKSLNNKQKLQYIWDYYKVHIIATAVIICVIISIASTVIKNTSVDIYTAYVNVHMPDELLNTIDDRADFSITNYIDLLLTDDPDGQTIEYAYASSLKIMSSISAGDLDIIIADKVGIDNAYSSGYLCNAGDYLQKENPALYDKLEPYFLYNENNECYAIDLSYSSLFSQAGFTDSLYIGIVASEDISPEVTDYLSLLF